MDWLLESLDAFLAALPRVRRALTAAPGARFAGSRLPALPDDEWTWRGTPATREAVRGGAAAVDGVRAAYEGACSVDAASFVGRAGATEVRAGRAGGGPWRAWGSDPEVEERVLSALRAADARDLACP